MKFSMPSLIKNSVAAAALLAAAPLIASAQSLTYVNNLIVSINNIVRLLIPLLISLAVVGLFWGLVKYIFGEKSEENRKSAIHLIVFSIIALIVMVMVWGIVILVANNLGITGNSTVTAPQVY